MKWGPKNGILIFVDNGPKAISFHAGVVLVSIFSVLFKLVLVMQLCNMLDFYLLPALHLSVHFKYLLRYLRAIHKKIGRWI
jgi:hypothetical protein